MRPILVIVVFSLFLGGASAQLHPPVGNARYDESSHYIFRDNEITTIRVTMSSADQQAMFANPWSDIEYPCTIRFTNSATDEVVNNVTIRVRGATSRGAWKKSFKISFNQIISGTRFHGVKKFNVIGAQNDVSVVRTKMALDLLRELGLPSQRTALVHFVINSGSRADDLYVLTEQINNDYLKAWYDNNKGNLYKGGYKGGVRADFRYVAPGTPSTYENLGNGETYVEENNEDNPDFTDLADFIRFINFSTDQEFQEGLPRRFNLDTFLRTMAADVVIGNWDNVWYGANNWYLYHNPTTDLFEWIPYDLDNTYGIDFFGVDWARRPITQWGSGGFGSNPDISPLMRRILAVPHWEGQMRRHIAEIVGRYASLPPPIVYEDPRDDIFLVAEPHFDIVRAEITNSPDAAIITVNTAGPMNVGGGTDQARFLFFFDTGRDGRTDNPWGRAINSTESADYFVGVWTDGSGGFVAYRATEDGWTQDASSDQPRGINLDLASRAQKTIHLTMPRERLGLAEDGSFRFDVVSTNDRRAGIEPGVDHLSNPDRATPDYGTPSTPGPFLTYTMQRMDPNPPDPVFSLNALGPKADLLRSLGLPYAFRGPTQGATMDHGWTNAEYSASFTLPTSYTNSPRPWRWGLKPFISTRAGYLRVATNAPATTGVVVNEVMSLNNTGAADEEGAREPWIELFNTHGTPVDLGGMYLSNSPLNVRLWKIPEGTVIPARGFLLFWADRQTTQGANHTSFTLGGQGQTVGLYDRDERANLMISYLRVPPLEADVSWGRYPDGGPTVRAFTNATPGAPNDPLRRMTWDDAARSLRVAGGLEPLLETTDLDMNHDGALDGADTVLILRRILHIQQ